MLILMQKVREDCEDASNELMLIDDTEVPYSLNLKSKCLIMACR